MQGMKSFIKLCVCYVLFYSGAMHLYIKGVLLKRNRFPALIINYHSFVKSLENVMETHPTVTHLIDDFEKEVIFLKKYFDIVSLSEVVDTLKEEKVFLKPTIVITVDDGFKDNFDLLFPVLEKHNISVTIFLSTGVINTNKRLWVNRLDQMIGQAKGGELNLNNLFNNQRFTLQSVDEKREAYKQIVGALKDVKIEQRDESLKDIEKQLGSPNENKPLMLSWDEIKLMNESLVEFGAHTVNHPILTSVSLSEAQQEIFDSKLEIEKHLKKEVKHFAFPNGRPQDFSEELRDYCKEIGFQSVSSCDFGVNIKKVDNFNLKRVGSEVPMSLYAFNVVRVFSKI